MTSNSFRAKPVTPVLQRGHPLARGLVAAFPFADSWGSGTNHSSAAPGIIANPTSLTDYSGNGNNATAFNNPPWLAGAFGSCVEYGVIFSTEYHIIQSSPSMNITGPISIAVWLATVNAGRGVLLGGYQNGSPYPGYALDVNQTANDVGYWYGGASWSLIPTGATIADGNWHFVAVTVDGGNTQTMYWDGQPVGTASVSAPASYNGVRWVGSDVGNFAQYFGLMDALLIYNRAISAAEVKQLYADPFIIYRKPSRWWETVVGAAPTSKPTRNLPIMGVGTLAPGVGVRVARSLHDNPTTDRRGVVRTMLGDYEEPD